MWYEPDHPYENYDWPAVMMESTYMIIDRLDSMPLGGSAGDTRFAFPLGEIGGQLGLGTFDGDGLIGGLQLGPG